MKYLDVYENFVKKISNNPVLMTSSVREYSKQIKELIEKYGIDPNIDELNEFINYKCKRRQPTAKYAIKHYLDFRWRKNVYAQLVIAKVRPALRTKTFVNKETALNIIERIKKYKHQITAKIQYFTGARVNEVVMIRKKFINHDPQNNLIKIDIYGKGGKQRSIYLHDSFVVDLKPLLIEPGRFLFLPEGFDDQSEEVIMKAASNYYKRYHESLAKAAKELNIKMSTHDWRRSFAKEARKNGVDILDIKKALGHKKIDTTERYFDDDPERVSNVMIKHQQYAI